MQSMPNKEEIEIYGFNYLIRKYREEITALQNSINWLENLEKENPKPRDFYSIVLALLQTYDGHADFNPNWSLKEKKWEDN